LVTAVYVIYWKGPVLRKRSPFAQHLQAERVEHKGAANGRSSISTAEPMISSRRSSYARSEQDRRIRQRGTRVGPSALATNPPSMLEKPSEEKLEQQ